jgi:hypothetical protein
MDTVIAEEASGIDTEAELGAEISEIVAEAAEGRLLEETALNALRFLADAKPTKGSGDKPKSGKKPAKKTSDKRTDSDVAAGKKKGRGKEQRTEDKATL